MHNTLISELESLQPTQLDALGDEHAAEKLISWCEVEGKPFTRLTVSPLN